MSRIILKSLILITLLLALIGCTMSPEHKTEKTIRKLKMTAIDVDGGEFTHKAFTTSALAERYRSQEKYSIKELRIYFEGDGQPYVKKGMPSVNPSSKSMLALKLMSQDPEPSIYLGRPCYGFKQLPEQCTPRLWTTARYSEKIISSLNFGLNRIKDKFNIDNFIFIGHSGGGSIATLLAARRTDVAALITIAANLDHKTWTEHFDYPNLEESLNAIDVMPLTATPFRWHLIGVNDRHVPAFLTKNALEIDQGSHLSLYKYHRHQCCWTKIWPDILKELKQKPNFP
ncbi:MAG: hypothetical protein ACI93R_003358 [Flavobacteriales bacterium]